MQKITINGKEYLERTESWEIRTGTEFDICMGHKRLFNECINPLPVREKKLIHYLSAGVDSDKARRYTALFEHNLKCNDIESLVSPRQIFTVCPNCWVDYMRQVLEIKDEQLIWDIVSAEAEAWIGVNQYPKLQTYLESNKNGMGE